MKAYIIGSVSKNELDIKELAIKLGIIGYEVRYVKKEYGKNLYDLIQQCYDNIEWCDILFVYLKNDNTIGKGCLYELSYAKRLNKDIKLVNKIKE